MASQHLIDKKVALVTGAKQGIGLAIAQQLSRDGFAVALNDLSHDDLATSVDRLLNDGGIAMGVPADVSDRAACTDMVEEVVAQWGRLDVMVTNAGVVQVDPLLAVDDAAINRLFAVNIKGVLWSAQAAAAKMIELGISGKIITAGSAVSHMSHQFMGVYGMSKFAVRSMTQTLALELAAHGITVNAYCPGIVETGMWETIDQRMADLTGAPAGSIVTQILERIPLGRQQTPLDVADFVSFLASEKANYLTGQCVLTDGGLVMI